MCPAFLGLAQNEVLTVHRASIVHKHPIIAQILHAWKDDVEIKKDYIRLKGALDNFSLIPKSFSKKLRFLYH